MCVYTHTYIHACIHVCVHMWYQQRTEDGIGSFGTRVRGSWL